MCLSEVAGGRKVLKAFEASAVVDSLWRCTGSIEARKMVALGDRFVSGRD